MTKSVKGTQTERNLLAAFAGESQARNRYTFFASIARKEGYEQVANIFAETARKEGFAEIATSFKEIAEVEEFHEKRYRKLAKNIAAGEVFKKKTSVKWHCTNCGYIHEGIEAPKECPACKHAQSYYELLVENY